MLQSKLTEGLKTHDLKDQVSDLFTVDQFKSKMGEDKKVIVLAFKVKDKYPAIDLMEFIEKGYPFVLDADMSSGEERDGQYSVFVEIERTKKAPGEISNLINGISQLCDCYDWRFRYHKEIISNEFSKENIIEHIPLTPEEYEEKLRISKQGAVSKFLNQGATESIEIDNDNTITVSKPFAQPLTMKLLALGEYDLLKDQIQGSIQLDESSRSQTLYLEKYLGNYEIHKIDNKFLIRNGDKALIITKERW